MLEYIIQGFFVAIVFVIAYLIGSARTFARMRYYNEDIAMLCSTALPHYGRRP